MESASQFTWYSLIYSLIRNNDNLYLYSQIHSIQSIRKRGEGDQKIFICLLIRIAIICYIKDEETIEVKREVKIKLRIQETKYSGETSRAWLFSEICGIYQKYSHTVKPKPRKFLTGENVWSEIRKRNYLLTKIQKLQLQCIFR